MDKLLHKEISLNPYILTSFYEVSNVLFWIALPVKL